MKTVRRRLAALCFLPLLAVAAGCASKPAGEKAAAKVPADEYVTIMTTGSNIPKRIKKSDIQKDDLPKDGDAQVVDKEQFLRSLGPGKKLDRGN